GKPRVGRDHPVSRGEGRAARRQGQRGAHAAHLGRRRLPGDAPGEAETKLDRPDSHAHGKRGSRRSMIRAIVRVVLLAGVWVVALAAAAGDTSPAPVQTAGAQLLAQYCVTCHNQRTRTAGLALDTMDVDHVERDAATWEKVVRKIRT